MTLALPAPILAYFKADRQGGEAIAHCFKSDGVVRDENHEHVGHEAIRRWKDEASAKYNYTSEPLALREEAGRIIVTARVVGDFPSSSIELSYRFLLEGDAIASLEIGG